MKNKHLIDKSDLDIYIKKLQALPPVDKKTELLLRTIANAILDRIENEYNQSKNIN